MSVMLYRIMILHKYCMSLIIEFFLARFFVVAVRLFRTTHVCGVCNNALGANLIRLVMKIVRTPFILFTTVGSVFFSEPQLWVQEFEFLAESSRSFMSVGRKKKETQAEKSENVRSYMSSTPYCFTFLIFGYDLKVLCQWVLEGLLHEMNVASTSRTNKFDTIIWKYGAVSRERH